MHDQQEIVQDLDNGLKTPIASLFIEDQEVVSDTETDMPSQQAIAANWLSSVPNSHAPS